MRCRCIMQRLATHAPIAQANIGYLAGLLVSSAARGNWLASLLLLSTYRIFDGVPSTTLLSRPFQHLYEEFLQ